MGDTTKYSECVGILRAEPGNDIQRRRPSAQNMDYGSEFKKCLFAALNKTDLNLVNGWR